MSEEYTYNFINHSKTARKIVEMTEEDIVNRYLITDPEIALLTKDDAIELWRNEFFDEAYLPAETNKNIYAHPFTASLSGAPLSHIPTIIKDSVIVPFAIKEGLKINAKTLVMDLERILRENYADTMKSVGKNQASNFIKEVTTFFVGTLLTGIVSISEFSNENKAQ